MGESEQIFPDVSHVNDAHASVAIGFVSSLLTRIFRPPGGDPPDPEGLPLLPRPTRPSGSAGSAQMLSGAVACEPACLVAYRAEQAVTHLSHDGGCTALYIDMPASAEVGAGARFQPVCASADVCIRPQVRTKKAESRKAHGIGSWCGFSEQPLDFFTCFKDFCQ